MYKLRLTQQVNGMLVTIDGKTHLARKLVDETGNVLQGFLEILGCNEPTICYVGADYLKRNRSEPKDSPEEISRGLYQRTRMGLI